LTEAIKESLIIRNPTQLPIAFKVKTTAPKQYCVRPNSGRIEPGQELEVQGKKKKKKKEPATTNNNNTHASRTSSGRTGAALTTAQTSNTRNIYKSVDDKY
jgi:hypothetical protein